MRLFKLQPLTTIILLLCGTLSAFGQEEANFTVTVAQASEECNEWPPCTEILPSYYETNVCLTTSESESEPENNADSAFGDDKLVANFNISTLYVGYEGNIPYADIFVKVEVFEDQNLTVPVELFPGEPNPYAYYSPYDGNSVELIKAKFEFNTPSACELFFRFTIIYGAEMGETPYSSVDGQVLKVFHTSMRRCTCTNLDGSYEDVPQEDPTPNNETNKTGLSFDVGEGGANVPTIHLYPNPVSDESMMIETKLGEGSNTSEKLPLIQVFNLEGKTVLNKSLLQPDANGEIKVKLNTEDLPKGIYLLQIKYGEMHINKKFIKN